MSDSSENLGGDSDSDQDLFEESRRRQNRQRAREEAIYGVFYDDDNHDSYDRRRGGRGNRPRDDGGMNIAPEFVKGKTTKMEDSEEDGGDSEKDDDDDMFQSSKDDSKQQRLDEEEEEETEEDKARVEEERRKQEAANDYFMKLLQRGKGEKDRKPVSSIRNNVFQQSKAEQPSAIPPASLMGLGFSSSSAGGGLGFSSSSTGGGLGFTPSSRSDTTNDKAPSFSPASGLGMSSSAQGLGIPTAFGAGKKEEIETFVKDPNIGSWEKHTKGIGMKLLAKMGYKGSGGLGSTRRKKKTIVDEKTGEIVEVEAPAKKGISRPVEVVVRPNNLGLGYGNFKEATKLKTNQQIEAEVRGIDLKKKEKEEKEKEAKMQSSSQPKGTSSALPSVQDLMQQKAWKRGAKQSQKSRKKPRRTIIPYQELLEKHASQQAVVIDMRGPSTTASASGDQEKPQEVPLAEELLHNLSLLLNTYENKIHSGSHFVRSTKQKVQSLQSDMASMEQRQKENRDRVAKLKKVLETLDRIEDIVNKSASRKDEDGSDDIAKVQDLVRELQDSFTPDERAKLRFFEVLAPSLLEPIIQTRLEHWDPLQNDAKSNNETMEMVISFCKNYPAAGAHDTESKFVMARTLFTNFLLPRVKKVLESQRWDPIHDVEIGLQLYEGLCCVAEAASPPLQTGKMQHYDDEGHILQSEDPDSVSDGAQRLKDLVQEEIIHKTVYFRLSRALSNWKPCLDESGLMLQDRPNLWILPWIPHLDHRSILPTLLADCKRKIKTSLSFLLKNIGSEDAFCNATLQTVRPWCKVLPKETVQSLASTSVIFRIASYVAGAASSAFSEKDDTKFPVMDWNAVEITMEFHSGGLLPDKEFLSIIEGELLCRWASRMQAWLYQQTSRWSRAAEVYVDWRSRILSSVGSASVGKVASSTIRLSLKCLQEDKMVCTVFYSILLMIQAAHESNKDLLDDLKPTATNARAVLARRTREERERVQEELYRMEATGVASGSSLQDPDVEARVRAAQRKQGHTPTFREVVEDFARDNDVLFQPRMGHNATKDGKQVFLFGAVPIYFDSDVVFAYQNSELRPTSLTQLGMIQKAKS